MGALPRGNLPRPGVELGQLLGVAQHADVDVAVAGHPDVRDPVLVEEAAGSRLARTGAAVALVGQVRRPGPVTRRPLRAIARSDGNLRSGEAREVRRQRGLDSVGREPVDADGGYERIVRVALDPGVR